MRDVEDWEDVIVVFAQIEKVRYFSTDSVLVTCCSCGYRHTQQLWVQWFYV